jgi:GntR family transcriptional regulator
MNTEVQVSNPMIGKFVRVDPLSAVPKYYQLAEILRQKIDSNDWRPHDSLPPERELETLYNVSRTTVREALNYLASQGYIYREHGRGTFVARPKIQPSLHLLQSFTADMQVRGFVPGQRILGLDYVTPSNRIRQQLDLSPHINQVLRLERLRYANDEPIGLHIAYLPLLPEQTITQEELQATGSLYALLEAKFGLIPLEADVTVEATTADRREATLLKVNEGSPLLLVERTTFSQHRQPMEFVKVLYRADRYKYYVHMTR